MTPVDRETAIASGTVLLTAKEVAPRVGYSAAKCGQRRVLAMVTAGVIPAVKLNARVVMFHWPTVVAALGYPKGWRANAKRRAALSAYASASTPVEGKAA